MRALREMGGGLIIGIVSLILVIGGISLSLAENAPPEEPTPSPLPPIVITSIELPTDTPIFANTNTSEPFTPIPIETVTQIFAPNETQPAPIVCNPPTGWIQIVVGANDTLYSIAERYKTTTDILNASNCLNNAIPAVGSLLYAPPVPTVTVIPCGPLAGWIKAYRVQPGDNLYRISLLYRTTVAQIQRSNCMGNSTTIYVGQLLYAPNVPTSTPGVTVIPNFDTPTATATPPPTSTFMVTESPVPTTAIPTDTTAPTIAPSTTEPPPTATLQ